MIRLLLESIKDFISLPFLVKLQSITGAMSTINPPVELEDPSKQFRLEFIQNIATQPDFDYPQVSFNLMSSSFVYLKGAVYTI